MFSVSYAILVLIATLPLTMTILRDRGSPRSLAFIHRIYRDLAYIAVAVVAIIVLETIFRVALQNYWFGELGQQYRLSAPGLAASEDVKNHRKWRHSKELPCESPAAHCRSNSADPPPQRN